MNGDMINNVRRRVERDELDEEPVFAASERKQQRQLEHEAKMKQLFKRAEQRKNTTQTSGSGGKASLKSKLQEADYLQYERDFGKVCFHVAYGILLFLALGLLYVMWFTDWIR